MNKKIAQYWAQIQRSLFPGFEEEVGALTNKHAQLAVVLDWLNVDQFFYEPAIATRPGRPPVSRAAMTAAFVAKSVLNIPTTKGLIDRLNVDKVLQRFCGFDLCRKLPSEGTFSNAFREFSEMGLPGKIHEKLIKTTFHEFLDDKIIGHISRDSTDISARGRAEKGPRKKRVKGKARRLVRQRSMNLEEMLNDLPKGFDASSKRGHTWKGYKLHLDVADGGVPISAIVTSASLHDSQAAIPLEEMTSRRVTSLYSLMDSAYDAKEIRAHIIDKSKVPIIEPKNGPHQTRTLDPAERRRYGERSAAERANSELKDNFGAKHVRVRGYHKVTAHLMFGVAALAALQIVRHFT